MAKSEELLGPIIMISGLILLILGILSYFVTELGLSDTEAELIAIAVPLVIIGYLFTISPKL